MSHTEIPGIGSLRPSDVQQHLLARGWSARDQRDDVLRFERTGRDGVIKVTLLQNSRFDDFAKRMTELVEVLAAVERRSVLEIVDELSLPPGDMVAFRAESELIESGTILVDDGLRIRLAQRNLFLSTAHSVLEPQPNFPRMSKVKALDFLAGCREGQTARGSYVTRILVPVSPAVGRHQGDEPFGRLVVRKLAEALSEVYGAVRRGTLDVLLSKARQGVSANFLHALAAMHPPGERGALEVGIQWSRTRPAGGEPPLFRFDAGYFEPLAAVAATLKEANPSPGFEVEGYVAVLKRKGSDSEQPGVVVIATTLEEGLGTSTVRVELAPEDYRVAMDAHASADRVRVIGTLVKSGRSWRLERPAEFQRLPDSSDEEEADSER